MKDEIIVITLSRSDLQDLIVETVSTCLRYYYKKTQSNCNEHELNEDEFLNTAHAAQFLNISISRLFNLIKKHNLPYIVSSKRYYFSKLKLIDYLNKGKID